MLFSKIIQDIEISNYFGLSKAEGIDSRPNGNILIGDDGTSAVKLFDNNGNFVGNVVGSGAGGLIRPNAVRIREIN